MLVLPLTPVDAVAVPVPEAAPLPPKSAANDCKSCASESTKSLVPLGTELPVLVLPVVAGAAPAVAAVLAAVAPDASPEMVDASPPTTEPRSANRLLMPLPDSLPCAIPLALSAASPAELPNDNSCDIKSDDSDGDGGDRTALADVPLAACAVAAVPAGVVVAADDVPACAALSAASCAQRSLCPDMELTTVDLLFNHTQSGECRKHTNRPVRCRRPNTPIGTAIGAATGASALGMIATRRFLPGQPMPPGGICRAAGGSLANGTQIKAAMVTMAIIIQASLIAWVSAASWIIEVSMA